MPKAHRNRPVSYPIGVLPEDRAEPPAEAPESQHAPPAASARKAEWEAYAISVGVDPTGLSKAQIRAVVG
jgi:hypothetical protein